WTEVAGLALPAPRAGASAVTVSDGIVLMGGTDGTAATRSVWKAQADPKGKYGGWAEQTPLFEANMDGFAAHVGDVITLVGGTNDQGQVVATVQQGLVGDPEAPADAPWEYIMMFLVNSRHEGLTILPTHRLLRNLGAIEPESFLQSVDGFFDVVPYLASESGMNAWREGLRLCGERKETIFGFAHRGGGALYLLKARKHPVRDYLASKDVPEVLRPLDVVVLDQVLLRHVLGLTDSFLANENNIHFKHDLGDALAGVQSGPYEAGFFINSTRIEQVQEVANAALIMPHKATYFYPKVGSGLVINPLLFDEEMAW
ncbi:MAG: DUF1015 domain-containing protein, partial [Syntrophobacteraceae bacterium]|nr:DUF1015 domain-containing protein [Syntrophobacteraceae bacterium]